MKTVLLALLIGAGMVLGAEVQRYQMSGTILSVVNDGYLVQEEDGRVLKLETSNKGSVDGDKISGMVLYEGKQFRYTTAQGAAATVRCYRLQTQQEREAELEAILKHNREVEERNKARKAEVEAEAKRLKDGKDAKARASYILWLRQQLTNAPTPFVTNELKRLGAFKN